MVKDCTYDEIRLRPQRREYSKGGSPKQCEGFDTETDKGYARIAATSEGFYEIRDIAGVLEFLTQRSSRERLNVFYNLAFDVECLFKWEIPILRALAQGERAAYGPYKISYLPKKCLTVRDGSKHTWRYYDVAQFYNTSLANASRLYLNEEPHELKGERATLFRDHTLSDIGAYCRDDADKTRRLGDLLLSALKSAGVVPKRLYSAGYVSQEYVLYQGDVPSVFEAPPIVNRMYWMAYKGGWFDTYKRGRMEITSYDLRSAYPWAMSQLPDLRDGRWVAGLSDDAALGVVRATLRGGPKTGSPIAVPIRGLNFYPYFDKPYRLCLTLDEYRRLRHDYDITVDIAYHFQPHGEMGYPYKELCARVFKEKQRWPKDDARYLTNKLIANSFYGKTVEVRKDKRGWVAGKLFNPVYGAETTARVRMKMYEAARPYADSIVSVLTDGIMFDEDIRLPTGDKLGDWDRKHQKADCLMVRSGIYQFKGGEIATRGFSRRNSLFRRFNTGRPIIKTQTLRPRHYRECLVQNDVEQIGVFEKVQRTLDLNSDVKRIWPVKIESGRQMLKAAFGSLAVPVSLLPLYPHPRLAVG